MDLVETSLKVLLLAVTVMPACAKDKSYPATVTALQDGTVTEVNSFNRFTNIVKLSSGESVTLGCSARAVWEHCYQLKANEQYPARFDNKGHVWVRVTPETVLHHATPWTKEQPRSESQRKPVAQSSLRARFLRARNKSPA